MQRGRWHITEAFSNDYEGKVWRQFWLKRHGETLWSSSVSAALGITEISIYHLIFQSAGAEDFKNEELFGNKAVFSASRPEGEQPGRQDARHRMLSHTYLYPKGWTPSPCWPSCKVRYFGGERKHTQRAWKTWQKASNSICSIEGMEKEGVFLVGKAVCWVSIEAMAPEANPLLTGEIDLSWIFMVQKIWQPWRQWPPAFL